MEIQDLGPIEQDFGRLVVETDAGSADFPLGMEVPMFLAEVGPENLVVFRDSEQGLAGIVGKRVRVAVPISDISAGCVAVILPGKNGDGMVGLELTVSGEDHPFLLVEWFDPDAKRWFVERREIWKKFFGVETPVRDFGRHD